MPLTTLALSHCTKFPPLLPATSHSITAASLPYLLPASPPAFPPCPCPSLPQRLPRRRPGRLPGAGAAAAQPHHRGTAAVGGPGPGRAVQLPASAGADHCAARAGAGEAAREAKWRAGGKGGRGRGRGRRGRGRRGTGRAAEITLLWPCARCRCHVLGERHSRVRASASPCLTGHACDPPSPRLPPVCYNTVPGYAYISLMIMNVNPPLHPPPLQVLFSSTPLWAALMAGLLLPGESMGPLAWLGGAVMLGASLLASLLT